MKKANILIASSVLLSLMQGQNPKGSFNKKMKQNALLKATKLVKRRGYIITIDKEAHSGRVHFTMMTPKSHTKIGGLSVRNFDEQLLGSDDFVPTNVYRVQGVEISQKYRNLGIGKVLYMAALVYASDNGYWLGGDRGFMISMDARRIYDYWFRDPQLEHVRLSDLGFSTYRRGVLSGQRRRVDNKYRDLFPMDHMDHGIDWIRHNYPDFETQRPDEPSYIEPVRYVSSQKAGNPYPLRKPLTHQDNPAWYKWAMQFVEDFYSLWNKKEVERIRKAITKEYDQYQSKFNAEHKAQHQKIYKEASVGYVYQLKPRAYPEIKKMIRGMFKFPLEEIITDYFKRNKTDYIPIKKLYSLYEYHPNPDDYGKGISIISKRQDFIRELLSLTNPRRDKGSQPLGIELETVDHRDDFLERQNVASYYPAAASMQEISQDIEKHLQKSKYGFPISLGRTRYPLLAKSLAEKQGKSAVPKMPTTASSEEKKGSITGVRKKNLDLIDITSTYFLYGRGRLPVDHLYRIYLRVSALADNKETLKNFKKQLFYLDNSNIFNFSALQGPGDFGAVQDPKMFDRKFGRFRTSVGFIDEIMNPVKHGGILFAKKQGRDYATFEDREKAMDYWLKDKSVAIEKFRQKVRK